MRLRRQSLLASSAMRHLGIMFAEGDGSGGAGGMAPMQPRMPQQQGNQQADPANPGGGTGNSTAQTGTGESGQNNNGNTFDGSSFWNKPEPAAGGSPSGGSAESPTAGSGAQQQAQPGADIVKQLNEMSFAPVFTPEISTQIAEGKLDGINKIMSDQMKQSTQQAVSLSAQLMKLHGAKLMEDIGRMLDDRLGSRDNNQALSTEFPTYNQPGMKPVIDGIFSKAMENTKNDRTAAIKMTRDMLQYVGKTGAKDMGLTTAPPNGGDNYDYSGGDTSKSLVDELLGRS